jgi:hypothetical protein
MPEKAEEQKAVQVGVPSNEGPSDAWYDAAFAAIDEEADAVACSPKSPTRLPKLPNINRTLLLRRTLEALAPPKQQFLPGHERKHRHIGKGEILDAMLSQVNAIAAEHADAVYEKSRHHAKPSIHRKAAVARVLADAWAWPELFDGRRGIARQEDIHYRRSRNKWTGKPMIYKGVDKAFLRLLEWGVSVNELFSITREFMANNVESITGAELKNQLGMLPEKGIDEDWVSGSAAARMYAERIKPKLGSLIWREMLRKEDFAASVDHNLIFVLHLCLRKEISRRRGKENAIRFMDRSESREQRQRRIAFDRRDVRELIFEKNVPADVVLDAVRKPRPEARPHRSVNRFAMLSH